MGLATDTSQTFAVVLPADRDKPAAERPEFFFHHPSVRELRRMMEMADRYASLHDNPGDVKATALIDEIEAEVRSRLASWRRVRGRDGAEMPFDPAALADVVTMEELAALLWGAIEGTAPTPAELGNSASPSPSATGGPAGADAPAGGAAATKSA